MIEIEKLRFKEMWKDEVIAWGQQVGKIIEPLDPAGLGLSPVLAEFKTQWERLDPLMQNIAGSVLTNDVSELDDRRDKDLVGIKLGAKSNLNHRNAAKVEAAELIINTMDSFHKNIPKQSLVVQTKTVEELVKLFEGDAKVKAAMDLLNLTEWVAPMKATNIDFGNKFLDRTREVADRTDTSFLEQRVIAETVWLKLIKAIDYKNTFESDAKLDKLIAQLNELITKYNQIVAQRKGRTEKNKATDTGS